MTVSAHRERRSTGSCSEVLSTLQSTDALGRHISIISISLGAGHDAASNELARRLRGVGATVDQHDLVDLLPFGLGRRTKRLYEVQLRVAPCTWGWLMRSLERFRLFTGIALWVTTILAGRRVRRAVSGDLDAVVTTYPMANHALGRLRRHGRLRCPVVTYLVNMAAHRVWVARGVDLYLAPSEVSAQRLRRLGARNVLVAGLPVSPSFAPPTRAQDATTERRNARKRFGLPADAPLALIMAGAWAVGDVLDTARDIAATGAAVPVTVCAHNDELRQALIEEGIGTPVGWVDDMPALMRACDVVVSNAGGASALEALVARVPLISYRCVPGHGVDNAVAFAEAGLAPLVRDRSELAGALRASCAGKSRPHPEQGLAGTPDPALLVVAAMGTGPVPVRPRRLYRRLVATTAAVVAGLWLATAGTGAAVAHGFRAARPHHGDGTNVYLVVALPDDRPTDTDTLDSIARAHAAVAVSQTMAEHQPTTVQAAAAVGLELVNAGPGRPYETGVVENRRAVGRTAADIQRLTGRYPRLLLSDGSLDAIDVMAATWYHERILIPDNAHESGTDPDSIRGGKVVLVSCYGQSSCRLDSLLDQITVQADDKSLSLAPTAALN